MVDPKTGTRNWKPVPPAEVEAAAPPEADEAHAPEEGEVAPAPALEAAPAAALEVAPVPALEAPEIASALVSFDMNGSDSDDENEVVSSLALIAGVAAAASPVPHP